MGYYLEGPENFGKATHLMKSLGAVRINAADTQCHVRDPTKAVICVVTNPELFEAAGFCYDEKELDVFLNDSDGRPRVWLVAERDRVLKELVRLGRPFPKHLEDRIQAALKKPGE